jgi:hypothetical protein
MRYWILFIALAAYLIFAGGCGSAGGSGFTVTSYKDGQVVGVQSIETIEVAPTDVSVTFKDGHVSWWVDAENPKDKQALFGGIINVITEPAGVLEIKFQATVGPNMGVHLGADNVVIPIPQNTRAVKVHAILTPGYGCVTCTCAKNCGGYKCKGKPGNWPKTELHTDYKYVPAE